MNKQQQDKENFLILFRHGDSRWNRTNRFTGWVDIPLSEVGIYECLISSNRLQGLRLDVAFTSKLIRAQEALFILLSRQDYTGVFMHDDGPDNFKFHHKNFRHDEIPIYQSEALNERYYGDLQGMDKDFARQQFGEDVVFKWRRGWKEKPPGGESLEDTHNRVVPYFEQSIFPQVAQGKNVIVSAHGNSLRAIIKHIDNIPDEEIPYLGFPTGQISIYAYSAGKVIRKDTIYAFDRPVSWEAGKSPVKKNHIINADIKS